MPPMRWRAFTRGDGAPFASASVLRSRATPCCNPSKSTKTGPLDGSAAATATAAAAAVAVTAAAGLEAAADASVSQGLADIAGHVIGTQEQVPPGEGWDPCCRVSLLEQLRGSGWFQFQEQEDEDSS